MLDTLKLKYFQGKQYIPNIKTAPMKEAFRGLPESCKASARIISTCTFFLDRALKLLSLR